MRVPGYFAGQFIGVVRALPCPIRGRMQYAPTLTVDCMGSFCQSSDLDAPSDVPDKGTNAGTRLFRRVICWGRPGPIVPVCGAYAVAPYISGSYFLTVRVGAYCIRSIRRPRQGDECGCPVISQGDLLGAFGLYRARLWGVCCCAPTLPVDCMGSFCQSSDLDAPSDVPDKGTNAGAQLFRRAIYWGHSGSTVPVCGAYAVAPLSCRSIVWGHFANCPTLTPHKTSPTRGRMWVWGLDVASVFGTAEGAEGT